MKIYICPNCGKEINSIRYNDNSICYGVTTKCKKCGKIVEILIKSNKTIDKQKKQL